MPDPGWPTPPRGWTFWTVAEPASEAYAATADTAYGTDRGSWLASLRARAASGAPQRGGAAETDGADAETDTETHARTHAETEDAEWALDGLLSSAGRVEA